MNLTPLDPWIQAKIGAGSGCLQHADLEAYQIERLRQVIRLCREKSRFYARRLEAAPAEISSLAELALFPFTTPEDLRREGAQFLCVPQGDVQRVVTLDTSGTLGEPKRIYFTLADQELTIDFFCHGMSTFTASGDRVMILLPHERPGSVGDLLAAGLTRLGATPVCYGPVRSPGEALAKMQAEGGDVLVGAPANVLTLARFWEVEKKVHRVKPGRVLLSTDHVPQAIATALEGIWGCTVYNHYGMTEMGLGGGVECQARRGYHLREADLYFEVIHPQTGQPAAEGESGEVVFTTLTRQGMPLIRYRTGDLSRFIPGQCPCGTALRTLEKITRRLDGEVILSPLAGEAAKLSLADLDEALFSLPQVVNFSAGLVTARGRDCLEIKLIVMPGEANDLVRPALLALEAVPAIQAARLAGTLEIRLQEQEFEAAHAGSLAKRMLVDHRGKNDA